MARNTNALDDVAPSTKGLIKILERATSSGRHVGNTFHDWVALCTFARRRDERARAQGTPAVSHLAVCEEEEAEYLRLIRPYGSERASYLAEALAMVLAAAKSGQALLGDVYEALAQSAGARDMFGQYFTPHAICDCIARCVGAEEAPVMVAERLDEAADATGVRRAGRDDETLWREEGARLKPHFHPISVIDPACGSGNLLHAFANQCAPWMRHAGMVWFYGIDLDCMCARMCALQLWAGGCAYRVYHGDGLATRLTSTVVTGENEYVPTLHAETLARFDFILANPPFGKQARPVRSMEPVLA